MGRRHAARGRHRHVDPGRRRRPDVAVRRRARVAVDTSCNTGTRLVHRRRRDRHVRPDRDDADGVHRPGRRSPSSRRCWPCCSGTATVAIERDALTLRNGTSGLVAHVDPDEPTSPDGDGLVGPTWTLESATVDGADVPVGERVPTLMFDGTSVAVDTGCNVGGGDYAADATTITFQPLMSTLIACDGADGDDGVDDPRRAHRHRAVRDRRRRGADPHERHDGAALHRRADVGVRTCGPAARSTTTIAGRLMPLPVVVPEVVKRLWKWEGPASSAGARSARPSELGGVAARSQSGRRRGHMRPDLRPDRGGRGLCHRCRVATRYR